jgi:hypothetical protein
MQPEELVDAARLWCRSKEDAYLPWLAIEATYSFEDNLGYFRDTVCANHRVWLAELDGAVVGLLAQANDFIDQLFVDPPISAREWAPPCWRGRAGNPPMGLRCTPSSATNAPGASTRSTVSAL